MRRIPIQLIFKPILALLFYVGAVLLSRMTRLFLTV